MTSLTSVCDDLDDATISVSTDSHSKPDPSSQLSALGSQLGALPLYRSIQTMSLIAFTRMDPPCSVVRENHDVSRSPMRGYQKAP